MNIETVEGRSFPRKKLSDFRLTLRASPGTVDILVNESAVREFGLTSPIGKKLYYEENNIRYAAEILGVIKDFHLRSLHHKIGPFLFIQTEPMHLANVKVKPADIPSTINGVEKIWKKVYGDRLFTFTFLDETFDRQYKSDEQLATIIAWFTGLAVIIACLGLFALSSFMITRRTKEIGIRKSMGASIRSIYTMLSWDFLKWIVVAVVIACPVAWYLMQLWLDKFAYHITIGNRYIHYRRRFCYWCCIAHGNLAILKSC